MVKSKKFDTKNIFHNTFKIGILLKAIDGVLEIVGGILLLFLNSSRLNWIIAFLTQRELSEDPKDKVANFLVEISSKYTISTQYFGVFYLISHGLIKIILVRLLWKRKPWAYPAAIIILFLFVIYQIYQYAISPSAGLILLTILDIIVIILTYIEYKRIKNTGFRK